MDLTKLRTLREGAGLSRSQLARMAMLDALTIYRWETGRSRPSGDLLARVLDVLGADLHDLSIGEEAAAPESP